MTTKRSTTWGPAVESTDRSRHSSERAERSAVLDTMGSTPRVAYIMSRFPKITETFILFEMMAAEQQSASVEVYPLWRERTKLMHEEARPYVRRAHFLRLVSWTVLAANLACCWHRPSAYFRTLWSGLQANWGSWRYFLGFVAVFPKAVAFGADLRRRGVQHIHAHFASHPAAAALVIHRLYGLPYSFTAHGSDLHRDVHMLREKVRDAEFVVAISEYNRRVIRDVCDRRDEAKIVVLHCGTDTDVFQPSPPDGLVERCCSDRQSSALAIACVGTLHEVKGQRFAIEAVRRLLDRGVPCRLELIGSGPDESQLRGLVKQLDLESSVNFAGRCTRDEIARRLRQADLLVAPSVPTRDGRREGIPVVLMEAMASGLPVVASRLSGIPELVADGVHGRLVPPGDVEALADALVDLASDAELRSKFGRAARDRILAEFDVRRNTGGLLELIRGAGGATNQEFTSDSNAQAQLPEDVPC